MDCFELQGSDEEMEDCEDMAIGVDVCDVSILIKDTYGINQSFLFFIAMFDSLTLGRNGVLCLVITVLKILPHYLHIGRR